MEIVLRLRKKDAVTANEAEAEATDEEKEEIEEIKEESENEKKDDGVFEIADSYADDDDE
jgi:hypothetical protein